MLPQITPLYETETMVAWQKVFGAAYFSCIWAPHDDQLAIISFHGLTYCGDSRPTISLSQVAFPLLRANLEFQCVEYFLLSFVFFRVVLGYLWPLFTAVKVGVSLVVNSDVLARFFGTTYRNCYGSEYEVVLAR